MVDPDTTVATQLSITGELPDGSSFSQQYDTLYEGETIRFAVPVNAGNLTAGTDTVIMKNIQLNYKDENGISRIRTLEQSMFPVISSSEKMKNQVSTDKPQYNRYDNVKIFDRVRNTSANRFAKNMVNIITVTDSGGNLMSKYSTTLADIAPKGFIERNEKWNTADNAAGVYKVSSKIYEGGVFYD